MQLIPLTSFLGEIPENCIDFGYRKFNSCVVSLLLQPHLKHPWGKTAFKNSKPQLVFYILDSSKFNTLSKRLQSVRDGLKKKVNGIFQSWLGGSSMPWFSIKKKINTSMVLKHSALKANLFFPILTLPGRGYRFRGLEGGG